MAPTDNSQCQLEVSRLYTVNNKRAVEQSELCGCIDCLKIFQASLVYEYTNDEDDQDDEVQDNEYPIYFNALCPFCGIDEVVPDSLVKFSKADLELWHQAVFPNRSSPDDSE